MLVTLLGLACYQVPSTANLIVEPDAQTAATWWPEQRNVWTPIGWKDHFFRFNVLYNGTVLAKPYPGKWKEHAKPWAGEGIQVTVIPSEKGEAPLTRTNVYYLHKEADNGLGIQGWNTNATPFIWTEWPLDKGLVLRKEMFAHVPGGADTTSGIEPLFGWIRLSIPHVDNLSAPASYSFLLHLSTPHIDVKMNQEANLRVMPAYAKYPCRLVAQPFEQGGRTGLRVLEPDGRVRLVALPSPGATYEFLTASPDTNTYYLKVTLPARKETLPRCFADILLPITPVPLAEVDAELALGLEGALSESDRFWAHKPKTAARFQIPERQIQEAIEWSLKFAELITEKSPVTGHRSFLSGSWYYDRLWPTPTSMATHMMLDLFGYQEAVRSRIELFRKEQGTVKPPGPSYELHPGYFSAPKSLTSVDWLTDHGAILHQIAQHALYTGDPQFAQSWLEPVLKACEFIQHARRLPVTNGVPGLMAPAVDTDRGIPNQSVWTIAWNYKGLYTAARLLRRMGHPRAAEMENEAKEFKATFVRALREHTKTAPRWTDQSGRSRPIVPASFTEGGNTFNHPFYLDAGPLVLVWAGLFDPEDELMRATMDFFYEGPNTRFYNIHGLYNQRAVLVNEMSSCEPCYSWNIYHHWRTGDRQRFLTGMYSILTGALSPQTYISCETRHGIYGTVFASPLLADLARLSVIDDQLRPDELHLLRLCPLAWISKEKGTVFENMPTEFGPVNLRWKLSKDGKALEVSFQGRFHHKPGKVVLHIPPAEGLNKVIINGKKRFAKPGGQVAF